MSGHSKWASIKHQKAIKDARRGASFTKLSNLLAVAARSGADPEMNFKLRLAIQKAKQAGMPNANIDRSIKRGAGEGGAAQVEEVTYEGYGPGGVGIIVAAATDNRNRTSSDVRTAITKHGGRMADTGSVLYQFDQNGIITIKADDLEQATLDAIEAGAADVEEDEENGALTVYTAPTELDAARSQLSDAGYEVEGAELGWRPKSQVPVADTKTAQTLMKLFDALDELDDVTETYANADIADEALANA